MVFQYRKRPFFPGNAGFLNFFNEPSAIIADKTHFIPVLEENPFEYTFLRPRGWGKSTFLNMLTAYYDVNTKDLFEDIFGRLYIGKAPTKSRNSHLILRFNLETITTLGSLEDIRRSICCNISHTLHWFLRKYRDILGDALPEEHIIPNSAATSLMNVLVSKFAADVYRGTKCGNRISSTEVALPLSLASTSTIPRPPLA